MKKRIVACIVTLSMVLSLGSMALAEETTTPTQEEPQPVGYLTNCYDPNGPIILEGAMDIETSYMMAALKNPKTLYVGPYYCVSGTYKGFHVVVLRTEWEAANASAAGDEGVDYRAIEMQGVYSYDQVSGQFIEKASYPCDEALLKAAKNVKNTYKDGKVVEGVISTGNEWNNQIDRMLFLHELTGSSCEEMESNAVAQICTNYGIPFIAIRILSNAIETHEEYDPPTGEACQKYVLNVAEEYMIEKSK